MSIDEIAKKNDALFKLCNRWIHLKIKEKKIADYLLKRDIKKIAVYGMGEMGVRLMEELENTSVEVIVGIDKNASRIDAPVEVIQPVPEHVEKWRYVDAVIITSVYYYNEIFYKIREIGYTKPVLALNDILMDM